MSIILSRCSDICVPCGPSLAVTCESWSTESATLCGWDEYPGLESTPPKKYRVASISNLYLQAISGTEVFNGFVNGDLTWPEDCDEFSCDAGIIVSFTPRCDSSGDPFTAVIFVGDGLFEGPAAYPSPRLFFTPGEGLCGADASVNEWLDQDAAVPCSTPATATSWCWDIDAFNEDCDQVVETATITLSEEDTFADAVYRDAQTPDDPGQCCAETGEQDGFSFGPSRRVTLTLSLTGGLPLATYTVTLTFSNEVVSTSTPLADTTEIIDITTDGDGEAEVEFDIPQPEPDRRRCYISNTFELKP